MLGLFASGYMTTRYAPLIATAAGSGSSSYRCQPNDRGDQPTLAEMTTKALALVDNPNGFFMQVESAQTDKGAHDGNICGSLGQVLEADKALEVILEYQRTHPDTLVVVTSDHGHATQIVRPGEAKAYGTLQTADGSPLHVGYSTSTTGQWHTGTQVPIAAKGPQAANVTGTIDQTELYLLLKGLPPAGTDVDAPVTTAAVAPAAGQTGWHTSVPVTVTLSASDPNGGSGVASTEYRLANGPWIAYAAPIAVGASGETVVSFRSTDTVGNVEAVKSTTVKIDSTAPTSSAQLSPAAPGPGGTYTVPVRVTLAGADAGGSGIDRVEYRLDAGDWRVYTAPFTIYTNGDQRVEYRAVDVAGLVGTANTVQFKTSGLSGPPASCVASSSDEFAGAAVDPKWTVLRPAPARYAVADGKLSIRFDGTNSDMSGATRSATNVFLQPAPTGGPWTVTAQIDMTDAKAQSNQAGLVLWQSEGPPNESNRFVKVAVNSRATDANAPSRPSWWLERQHTVAGATTGLGNGNAGYIAGLVPDTVHLRLVSSGGTMQTIRTLYSLDGVTWTEFMTPFTVDTTTLPLQVGLGLFRGENNPNGFARFEHFRVCDYSLDASGPVTTLQATPAAGGQDGWHTSSPVRIALAGDDGPGTGVTKTEYRINGGAWTTYAARVQRDRPGREHDRVPLDRRRRQRGGDQDPRGQDRRDRADLGGDSWSRRPVRTPRP